MRRPTGFTLIEILIGLFLSLLLVTIILRFFLLAQQTQHQLEDKIFLQTNSQLAVQILRRHIRTAGYIGCMRLRDGLTAQLTLQNMLHIQPQEITLRKLAISSAAIQKNDWVGVSNCRQLRVLPNENVTPLQRQTMFVAPLLTETFSVRKVTPYGKIQYGLYIKDNQNPAVELISGIDQLQAKIAKNRLGYPVAVILTLHFIAPYGASMTLHPYIALREMPT